MNSPASTDGKTRRPQTRILIVEDEHIVSLDLSATLRQLGYRVADTAATGEQAIQIAANAQPDLVIMNIQLKGSIDGIEAARIIRSRFDIPVIYLSAFSDDATLLRAKASGANGYIVKPYDREELKLVIEQAIGSNNPL